MQSDLVCKLLKILIVDQFDIGQYMAKQISCCQCAATVIIDIGNKFCPKCPNQSHNNCLKAKVALLAVSTEHGSVSTRSGQTACSQNN